MLFHLFIYFYLFNSLAVNDVRGDAKRVKLKLVKCVNFFNGKDRTQFSTRKIFLSVIGFGRINL